LLLVGIGYHNELNVTNNQVASQRSARLLEQENKSRTAKYHRNNLVVVMMSINTVVELIGQAAAQRKVYWNKQTEVVYIDAAPF
jgi:hypothetical protein